MLKLLEKPFNEQGWNRFLELGLPTKQEVFQYVKLKDLYKHAFALPTLFSPSIETAAATLVFVNGAYSETLSRPPASLIALPFSKAFPTYGHFLAQRLQKLLHEESNPFAALNHAYSPEGLFLYLPPNSICETPIQIIHLIGPQQEPVLLSPRIHLFVGKKAAAEFYFSQTLNDGIWSNSVIDLALEEDASITFCTLSNQCALAHEFLAFRATLKSGSVLKSHAVTNGAATSRHDYKVKLLGERAEAALYGVWNLKNARQHHVNVHMEHVEPSCNSLQKFKGILADTAHSSFEGKIYVHKRAQKTQAYQMNNNLILSERACANSKPNLEIFADDVKASHGATIGQLNADELFYLTTRGVPLEVARALLVKGFSLEIIDMIHDQAIRESALRVVV